MACVPLLSGDLTTGVLGFVKFGDRDWSPEELNALKAIASLVADNDVALVVHADEVIRRLGQRGREDDDAWVIKERLGVYSRETEPVLEWHEAAVIECPLYVSFRRVKLKCCKRH